MPILRIKTTVDQYATIRAAQHLAPDPPDGVDDPDWWLVDRLFAAALKRVNEVKALARASQKGEGK